MKAEFNWKMVFKTCVVGILCWAILFFLVACGSAPSVTDWRGSTYYYNHNKCPWDEGWANIINQVAAIQVLPWEEYRKIAWGHQVSPDTLGFQQGWAIWLKEGFQLDTPYHEISHIHDWRHGRTPHNPECWDTSRPYGYDEMVLKAMKDIQINN